MPADFYRAPFCSQHMLWSGVCPSGCHTRPIGLLYQNNWADKSGFQQMLPSTYCTLYFQGIRVSPKIRTPRTYIHTYIQIYIAPKIVRTNLRRLSQAVNVSDFLLCRYVRPSVACCQPISTVAANLSHWALAFVRNMLTDETSCVVKELLPSGSRWRIGPWWQYEAARADPGSSNGCPAVGSRGDTRVQDLETKSPRSWRSPACYHITIVYNAKWQYDTKYAYQQN